MCPSPAPTQPANLRTAQTVGNSKLHSRFQRLSAKRSQKFFQLFWGVRYRTLILSLCGQFSHDRRIESDFPHANSMIQALMNIGMVLANRVWRKPRFRLDVIVALKQGRGTKRTILRASLLLRLRRKAVLQQHQQLQA